MNIKENEKYTMIIENDFGITVAHQCRIHKLEMVKKDNYSMVYNPDMCPKLTLTYKGKRTKKAIRLRENKVILLEGWQNIKGVSLDNNEFTCFDSSTWNNVIKVNNINLNECLHFNF